MARLFINPAVKKSRINREIYGHFSEHLGRCIYEGMYVEENSPIPNVNGMRTDVVEALKQIRIPVLRWPGGCFADEYHWMDGIGPKDQRKKMINTHWGGVVEDNSFGTHEYFELCRQLGCESYINGNLGSGTVREMSEWVEYITFDGVSPMADLRKENGHEKPWKVKYFGVGNENWGCGGNMTPRYYADDYRRYQTYVRNYKKDEKIRKICCGANVDDYEWTEEVMKECFFHTDPQLHGHMDGLSLHYYVTPNGWDDKVSATEFDETMWYRTLSKALYMEELVTRHGEIMDKYDPAKEIGMMVDEWGIWTDVEPGTNPGFLYQQNTMRDAVVAGMNLNIFNKHSDRVKLCNLAQTVNVLQAVILTDGPDMVLTPTYHVFDLYKHHQDNMLLDSYIETRQIGKEEDFMVPDLTESVSQDGEGRIHITLANLSAEEDIAVETYFADYSVSAVSGEIVHGAMTDKNTFEAPDCVKVRSFDGITLGNGTVSFTIPRCSVLHLTVQ